ncbi:MAG: cytochrome c3 family protein [Planctomycetes bacterium]|nr:cytochrome c3 family protein [Planctomycetota bacterium]
MSWVVTSIVLSVCAAVAETPPDACVKCHEKEAAPEHVSVHFREQVTCVSCHGGDSAATEKEKSHAGQVRKIARAEVPALCAKCHSDVRLMNPYGIATDQFAQYQTSRHGLKLAEGDQDVATCADCHGAHGIRKVKDPESPVFPKNVPATCARCHADADLMKRHGLKSNAPKDYGESVHAKLLEKGDLSAPTCITCHGNHGATPPGVRDIIHVCGKCHVKEQELFSQTKHFALTEKGEFQSCVTCHRNHLIRTKQEDIRKSCKLCHGDETDPARIRFTSIFATIRGAEALFQGAKDRVQRLGHAGIPVDEEEALLEEAKTGVLRLAPMQHTLDESKVLATAQEAEATISEINRRLDGKERAESWKKKSILPIWGFLLGMAGLFWLKLGRIKKEAA